MKSIKPISITPEGTIHFEIEDNTAAPEFQAGDTILVDPERSCKHGDWVLTDTGIEHYAYGMGFFGRIVQRGRPV